jgi:hypothetical protein
MRGRLMQEFVASWVKVLVRPFAVVLAVVWLADPGETAGAVAFLLMVVLGALAASRRIRRRWRRSTSRRALAPGRRYLRPPAWPPGWATTAGIQAAGLLTSTGLAPERVYLGRMDGVFRCRIGRVCVRTRVFAPRGESALVLGPTGSGKTSSVLAPTLVGWGPGPVVVTSTKPDVLETWGVREAEGMNTLYDPTGSVGRPDLCVGWSPLTRCGWWDGAVECAAVMLHPRALDTTSLNAQHFADMAKQLLAPLLHAAALAGRPIADARSWLLSAEFSEPLELLDQHDATTAREELNGVALLPFGEHLSGILATAATALGWVVRDSVRASTDPEETDQFNIDAFLDLGGTVYIVSPSRTMQELAPLTAALVDAIATRALERAVERGGRLQPRLLLALDEAANIAPLASLPSLVAEGGTTGCHERRRAPGHQPGVRAVGPRQRAHALEQRHPSGRTPRCRRPGDRRPREQVRRRDRALGAERQQPDLARPHGRQARLRYLGELGVEIVVDTGRAFATWRRGAAPRTRGGPAARALTTAGAARAPTGTADRRPACA